MQLVIHAGVHRTGTTSLQRALEKARPALAARGIVYPGTETNQQALAWALHRKQSGAAEVRAILAEAGAAGAHTVVLSGEDFTIHRDLGWLAPVAAAVDTRVVFYLRRQDHWLMSWYNQHIKWPFDPKKSRMDPQAFLGAIGDFHWIDYAGLLDRWAAVLGDGRVGVGVVERGQVGDVTADFFDRLGVGPGSGPDGIVPQAERSNDSLPVHMLEVARHLGLYEYKAGRRSKLLNALRAGLADKAPATPVSTVYSPAERTAVLARFAASNRVAARRWFGREALFLEPPPGPDAPYWRFPELSREELLREWVSPVIRSLIG